jgi:hypothetical protein
MPGPESAGEAVGPGRLVGAMAAMDGMRRSG